MNESFDWAWSLFGGVSMRKPLTSLPQHTFIDRLAQTCCFTSDLEAVDKS
jgi:hypothetical protein